MREIKDAPAFDFYPERWLVGTAAMSDAEQLAYLRLLCHQWTMDGLPTDPAILKRLGGKGVTDVVLSKFPESSGKRRNGRLEVVRQKQRKRIAESRDKIEKMNAARRAKLALQASLQEDRQEPLVEGHKDPSCRLPHHSPLTTSTSSEEEVDNPKSDFSLEPGPVKRNKARGTLEEVQAFVRDQGLEPDDAIYIFNNWQGKAWKGVKDWRAVIVAWKAAKYFPSQKLRSPASALKPAKTELKKLPWE